MRVVQKQLVVVAALIVALVSGGTTAYGQTTGHKPSQLEGVGISEKLGETISLDYTFTRSDGEKVSLSRYFQSKKPVILNFGYYNCPVLCDRIWQGLTESLKRLEWVPGDQFQVVTISIAPAEKPVDARAKKENLLDQLGKPAAATGWHFHTTSKTLVDSLTQAVGFNYRPMKVERQVDESTQQYAHPAAILILTPDGTISRYLYGLRFEPRDMKNALVEAGKGNVGSIVDRVILYCSQYDPDANKYVADARNIMKLGGLLTVLLLGGTLFVLWRRERRQQRAHSQ